MNLPREAIPGALGLRARFVLPIVSPPIEDGVVLIVGHRVAAVGAWKQLRHQVNAQVLNLGDVVLMPGLVNAHCHLDYTDMAGQIAPPRSFSDWIKALLALKAHRTYSDYALSWLRGARMLLAHGVTTVADIEAVPELLPDVLAATPLRVCTLLEITGVRSRRPAAELLQAALNTIDALPMGHRWAGLSPHAPYSTTAELLRLAGQTARQWRCPLAIHVAESSEEFKMYMVATGAMFDWLKQQREMSGCGQGSPVRYLAAQGLLSENVLAIHANYLAKGDADLLAHAKVNVVHCPRSHDYFGHRAFPIAELSGAGVNICLGTDSLASVRSSGNREPVLDLFAEMRALADRNPHMAPEAVVRLSTINPARALGMSRKLGEISVGASADLTFFPSTGSVKEAYQSVVSHEGPTAGVMIDGKWVVPPHV